MIRRALPQDADAVAELYERSFALLDFLPALHSLAEHRLWFARVLAETETWVREEAGELLGFATLRENELSYLYVEPVAIGRGIGSALLEHAKEQRPGGFELWVFQQNGRARAFYERHGCRPVRFTDGSRNEERTPDVLYEWRPGPAR
ncbi:MAG: GNAT family N-acetyltransferase [Gaiellaceae bacterium]